MNKRVFICIAGIDGSGKSSVSKYIVDNLGVDTKYIWARWEPLIAKPFIILLNSFVKSKKIHQSDNDLYDAKKKYKSKLLAKGIFKRVWLFVSEVDYSMQLIFKLLIPFSFNKIIVCDRYVYDFYIDQLASRGSSPHGLNGMIKNNMLKIMPVPDLLIYIKISPETGNLRKNDGTSLQYLKDRESYYNVLPKIYNTIIVDGEVTLDAVCKNTLALVKQYIQTKGDKQ